MHGTSARSLERIRHHYDVEIALAERLRASSVERRKALYGEVYDELFRSVPDHPQLTLAETFQERTTLAKREVARFARYLDPDSAYLEIGPGDCRTASEVAARVRHVYAVDVSAEVAKMPLPANLELILSDGTSVPVPSGAVAFAYSNQLIEHLHPDDALEQTRNVFAALEYGGRYFCITPSKLSGPHDVSMYFDRTARGLHLNEYDARSLGRLFKQVGFRGCDAFVGSGPTSIAMPLRIFAIVEAIASLLPRAIRRHRLVSGLLNVKLLATK